MFTILENGNIFHIIDQIKVSRVLLLNAGIVNLAFIRVLILDITFP